jgi:hypothetical protein
MSSESTSSTVFELQYLGEQRHSCLFQSSIYSTRRIDVSHALYQSTVLRPECYSSLLTGAVAAVAAIGAGAAATSAAAAAAAAAAVVETEAEAEAEAESRAMGGR